MIEVRLARDTPAPGFVFVEPLIPGDSFYVAERAILSDAEIADVRVHARTDRLILDIQLTDEGTSRLEEVTAANIGRPMAVIVDSHLTGTPPVIRSITLGRMQAEIPTEVPEETRRSIFEKILARWP